MIWAPHHSILPSDDLGYANFLDMAEQMVDFAKYHEDKIEIAFKPHPILKEKLIFLNGWGIERTEKYYEFWEKSSNTILAEGTYADLFMTSDTMIHDSSSFICEYLYTKNPVMFLSQKPEEIRYNLNDLGKRCFDLHYIGKTIKDVDYFLENIVIRANDPLKIKRDCFFNEMLKQDLEIPVSQLIFDDMKSSFMGVEN